MTTADTPVTRERKRKSWDATRVSTEQLTRLLGLFQRGHLAKVDIERRFFGDWTSNGQRITHLWQTRLNVDTRKVHPLQEECVKLRTLLIKNGIDPNTGVKFCDQ